jgi:hypothetical protein
MIAALTGRPWKSDFDWAPRAVIIVSFALGMGLFYSQPSLADSCGAYCKVIRVRAICHDVVKGRGLTGHQRDVEFDKCKVDPMTHKQIEEITDDTSIPAQ